MNEALIQRFNERLKAGKAVFGPFMKTCDPGFVEAAGYAGMDFAILDMEHGPISIQNMRDSPRGKSTCYHGGGNWKGIGYRRGSC